MNNETRIPCYHCNETGGEFENPCPYCKGLGWKKGKVNKSNNRLLYGIITLLLLFLGFQALCQTPIAYGGSYQPQYFDYTYEGQYTLNEEWVLVEKDTFVGYWQDSLFVSKHRMFLFKPDRIEKLSKCIPMNTIFKNCSAGNLPYWSVIAENFNSIKSYYLVGFDTVGEWKYKILIQNPVHNTFTGQVRVEQNGIPFYLFNPIKNNYGN